MTKNLRRMCMFEDKKKYTNIAEEIKKKLQEMRVKNISREVLFF